MNINDIKQTFKNRKLLVYLGLCILILSIILMFYGDVILSSIFTFLINIFLRIVEILLKPLKEHNFFIFFINIIILILICISMYMITNPIIYNIKVFIKEKMKPNKSTQYGDLDWMTPEEESIKLIKENLSEITTFGIPIKMTSKKIKVGEITHEKKGE